MSLLAALIRAGRRLARHHIPAAPDNQHGTDIDAFITCRRIDRLPLTDPDIARPANTYLRDTGEETP